MDADELFFERKLRKWVGEEQERRKTNLAAGYCKNFDEYREKVGQIAALSDVLRQMDEIKQKLQHTDTMETA